MKKNAPFQPKCLSIDLEVGVRNKRIRQFAAVRGTDGRAFVQGPLQLNDALQKLDVFAEGLTFLLGHNIIAFDIPHLQAVNPELALLSLPAADTLRLNPLAFPRNPYHHLVKHYQDGQLHRGRLNDPELDARLTLEVFRDQRDAFAELNEKEPELLLAWHWLTTADDSVTGLNAFFTAIRKTSRPNDAKGIDAIKRFLQDRCCASALKDLLARVRDHGWSLAYAMAWLSVAGGNSVMPPWVRHQFPEAGEWVRKLRDVPCQHSACQWCRERHDARKELKRWFGFDSFREEPKDKQGRPLQELIVEAAMRGEHVLGILPTGTGKSLCYQIPALSRYEKTGAITLVVSPLVALMADQVAGLEDKGIICCAALNGLLSMPERADVLDRVRMGDIGILLVSPEQLRSPALRKALSQREVGAWILDEAHCISKWGHDFRPDYRYVGRFIREWSAEGDIAPVLCLTATAKPDVIDDILGHFRLKVGVGLRLFDGGTNRRNLEFDVVKTTQAAKYDDIYRLIASHLPDGQKGGAIVYCATRRQTEEAAAFLSAKELAAERYHAKLPPETKKTIQHKFIQGQLQVIAATNAFGMGIDKSDVRLVIHADIPGSLENYLQEAGRAGRDRKMAHCVLLYAADDVERQFSMSARGRLSHRDIVAIHKSLRRLRKKKRGEGEVIATSGEILLEDEGSFERDSATDDTRVRTALLWLEESQLLTREDNRVQIYPSSLRITSTSEAAERLTRAQVNKPYRDQLVRLVSHLIDADADEGLSTDDLMGVTGLTAEGVRGAFYDLEQLGIAANDMALTAFLHHGVANSSKQRLRSAEGLEAELIGLMRELAPDLTKGESSVLHIRQVTQRLKDQGFAEALPEKVWRLLKGLSMDGRSDTGGLGSIRLKKLSSETAQVSLQRDWQALDTTAKLRRLGAATLLKQLLSTLPVGAKGNDLLAETTLGKLQHAINNELTLRSAHIKDAGKLIDYALLWLHEQEVIKLNKGMAVFRPAMTIKLAKDKNRFLKPDFLPLKEHYRERVLQIHVMAEYAQRALRAMADALHLAMDYFTLGQDEFVGRWLPGRNKELGMQTTPESLRRIVDNLNNSIQQRIVADDREQTNVLVLAGPGAGKTRVLVHRIAYLVRVKRENPAGILALAYNRHTAFDIRHRLIALIGDDAKGVMVFTCHALAMRIVGASLVGRESEKEFFNDILRQAIALLKGDGLAPGEADEQRDRLLAGFRWILVDEYQDVGPEQYGLISALAGRTAKDADDRLSLFAVGDDDQNIYSFAGASVDYIRRFEKDYAAKPVFLTENYRSTRNIVAAANCVIEPADHRMKVEQPITINHARSGTPAGGIWHLLDPVSAGRVQLLNCAPNPLVQAVLAIKELQRLSALDEHWNWRGAAVIAREWRFLEPVRSYCELNDIPVRMADEHPPPLWRLRETRKLIAWIEERKSQLVDMSSIRKWLLLQSGSPWWERLKEVVEALEMEVDTAEIPVQHFIEWLAEWGMENSCQASGLLLLTAHRAKGLEFEHVIVLDGRWEKCGKEEDQHANRRLYYVAMTRAKQTLTLVRFNSAHILLDHVDASQEPFIETDPSVADGVVTDGIATDGIVTDGIVTDGMVADRMVSESGERIFVADRDDVADLKGLDRRYRRLTLRDVYIGYIGGFAANHAIHKDISACQPGDTIQLRLVGEHWQLYDRQGRLLGRLAASFAPPTGMKLLSATVIAVVTWRRKDSKPEYQSSIRCDSWEIILPELVYVAA